MTLYALRGRDRGNWIVEADIRSSNIGFYLDGVEKTPEVLKREEDRWRQLQAQNPGLYDGELISMRHLIPRTDGSVDIGINKSSYKEHHGSCPIDGERDEYTEQFFPYDFEVKNGVVVHKIPNFDRLFPAFAAATLVETSDGKLIYLRRSSGTDAYRGDLSLNSGGRFNGTPHRMVDELLVDANSIYDHIGGMLQQEYSGLDIDSVIDVKLTGIARSLDDLDVTLCAYTKVDLTYQQLVDKLRRDKYVGTNFIGANPDGMTELLRHPGFPSTVRPVIIQAASMFDLNPTIVIPGIEIISD